MDEDDDIPTVPMRSRHQDRIDSVRQKKKPHWRQECAEADAIERAKRMDGLIRRAELGLPLYPKRRDDSF